MKAVIIYYSYGGNAEKVADILAERLKEKGEVKIISLKALDESRNFFRQAIRAFYKKRAEIEPLEFDLSAYDFICLGTPVWAFGPAPAMNTYLDKCSGVKDKEIILFTPLHPESPGLQTGDEWHIKLKSTEKSRPLGRGVTGFTTYGSGTGNERCLDYMEELLKKKEAKQFRHFSVQQSAIENKELVLSKIKSIFL